jgi:Uma2 family endonuclease
MGLMVAPVVPGRWPDHINGEWTVEDLETLPDDGLRYELIDGILQVSPSPVPLHQQVIVQLTIAFSAACPLGYRVYVAPLDWQPDTRTSLEPDLLVVPKDAIGPRNITGTPALVVEVLSPSTARIDRMLKFSRYAEGGIGQYWIVDPAVPSIQVYGLRDGAYELLAEGTAEQSVSVAEPLKITVVPAALIAD